MLIDEVAEPRLSTKLVDALSDFVPRCVAQAGEERKEFAGDGGVGVFAEDDGAEAGL